MSEDFKYVSLCGESNHNGEDLMQMLIASGLPDVGLPRESICQLFQFTTEQLQKMKNCQNDDEFSIDGTAIADLPNYLKYPLLANGKTYCYHIGDLEKEIVNGNKRDHYNRIVFSTDMKKEILARCTMLRALLRGERVDEFFGVAPNALNLSVKEDRKQLLINLWVALRYPALTTEEYEALSAAKMRVIADVFETRNPNEPTSTFADKYTLAQFVLENVEEQPIFEYLLSSIKNNESAGDRRRTLADDNISSQEERKKVLIRNLLDDRLKNDNYGFIAFGRADLFALTKRQVRAALKLLGKVPVKNEMKDFEEMIRLIDSENHLRLLNAYILQITNGEKVVERFQKWLGSTTLYFSFLKTFVGVEDLYRTLLHRIPPGFVSKIKRSVYQDCLVEIMQDHNFLREIKSYVQNNNRTR